MTLTQAKVEAKAQKRLERKARRKARNIRKHEQKVQKQKEIKAMNLLKKKEKEKKEREKMEKQLSEGQFIFFPKDDGSKPDALATGLDFVSLDVGGGAGANGVFESRKERRMRERMERMSQKKKEKEEKRKEKKRRKEGGDDGATKEAGASQSDVVPVADGMNGVAEEEKSKKRKRRENASGDVADLGTGNVEEKSNGEKRKKRKKLEEGNEALSGDAGYERLEKKGNSSEAVVQINQTQDSHIAMAGVETNGGDNGVVDSSEKKERKTHKGATDGNQQHDPAAPAEEGAGKRSSRRKRKAKEGQDAPVADEKPSAADVNGSAAQKGDADGSDSKQHRFIVFVGNLPYTATTEAITSHFASVKPASVRHITHKHDPNKSKGFAFLEFEAYDRMETCLKEFHHSRFECVNSATGEKDARKLNVELTAGGGGTKSEQRNGKLKAKNEKLNEERKRWAEKEKEREREEASRSGGKEGGGAVASHDGIHPSRRSRVPAA